MVHLLWEGVLLIYNNYGKVKWHIVLYHLLKRTRLSLPKCKGWYNYFLTCVWHFEILNYSYNL